MNAPNLAGRPLGLLAELTYRCPLKCPYCSNPLAVPPGAELEKDEWKRILKEAAALGVLQCSFSGGEPLRHASLDELVACATSEGMYTNLITSAVGLNSARAASLKGAGLDNVQISFQAPGAELANRIAGTKAHDVKLTAARAVRAAGLNLSLNVVLNRLTIDYIEELAEMAEELDANRIELANVQFYGWAFLNRASLLPSAEQVRKADAAALRIKERFKGRIEVLYVRSDYYDERPKACMGGWGQRYITVDPYGNALPCPTARDIPGFQPAMVRNNPLEWIWNESPAFTRFRGEAWMREPCRSCEFRKLDFGGCRCQAALITGEPENADPVCSLSPFHGAIGDLKRRMAQGSRDGLIYREMPRFLET